MAILKIQTDFTGEVGVSPRLVRIVSSDVYATIITANYLKPAESMGYTFMPTDFIAISYSDGFGWFRPAITSSTITLEPMPAPGAASGTIVDGHFANFDGVTGRIKDDGFLPSDPLKTRVVMAGSAVQANYLAKFADILGTIDDTAGTAINAGVIQSGLSGTVGGFVTYPPTTGNGFLQLLAINAGGAFNTIISNSAMLQTSTISIPDPGSATANFILSDSTTAQTINTGISITGSNNVQTTGGGNFIAGSSGADGIFVSYPATAANGSLILAASNAGADFDMTISNGTLGQDSVVTISDPGNAAARFLISATATPFVSGEFPVASGVEGLMVSSGLAASNIQDKTNIKADSTADIGGAGAGPISVVVAGLTASSKIVATIASSSNVVSVAKCIATATGFDITFSGDPGAACVVNYVAFIVAQ